MLTGSQGFFVFASLISDYTLKFDEWIVTRPNFDGVPSAERKRWIGVLKTSLSYAIAEPLWYALMTCVSNQSPWWLLMGSFMHVQAIPATFVFMGQCMLDVLNKHNEICGDTKQLAKEEEGKANDESEKSGDKLPKSVMELGEETPPLPKVDLRPCLDRHPLPRIYSLAPLFPVATAAMSNAGLLFYTRYLSTPDSQKWYDNFAFGWIFIALLCVFMFTLSRWSNKIIHDGCGRPLNASIFSWDVTKYKLGALFLMVLLRGIVRSLLSQNPLTWFSYSIEGGIRLLGTPNMEDGDGISLDSREHVFDRMLAAIPPWVGTTISIANCIGIWGYIFYSRWRRSRQQHAEQQTAE